MTQLGDVQRMIEAHSLYTSRIGLTDAHLLVSALIAPFTLLRTRDKRSCKVAGDWVSARICCRRGHSQIRHAARPRGT
jgi:hypothetical protein